MYIYIFMTYISLSIHRIQVTVRKYLKLIRSKNIYKTIDINLDIYPLVSAFDSPTPLSSPFLPFPPTSKY